jgi:hypothetical protein
MASLGSGVRLKIEALQARRIACDSFPMTGKHPKRPRDTNQLAKRILDLAIGEASEPSPDEGKDPTAVARGRLGDTKGGKARAEKMTPDERKASSVKAIRSRWDRR